MAFPALVRRATAVSATTNATTWTPTFTFSLNTAIAAGERVLWVLILSSDGVSALTDNSPGIGGPTWVRQDILADATNAVSQAIFTTETTGAFAASAFPAFRLASSATEQFSAVLLAIKVGAGKSVGFRMAIVQGSSTNSNPPTLNNNTGASIDAIVIATRSGDSTVVATAAPTNYANLQSRAAGGTAGASTNTAERQLTLAAGVAEDPGTFTSANEQWVSATVFVWEFGGAAPTHLYQGAQNKAFVDKGTKSDAQLYLGSQHAGIFSS